MAPGPPPPDPWDGFFRQLDQRRRALGWSQRELADRAGCSSAAISKAKERGSMGRRLLAGLLEVFPDLAPYAPGAVPAPVLPWLEGAERRLAAVEARQVALERLLRALARHLGLDPGEA
jgi:transcriptional regulator with XRE-family HTH domain